MLYPLSYVRVCPQKVPHGDDGGATTLHGLTGEAGRFRAEPFAKSALGSIWLWLRASTPDKMRSEIEFGTESK